jgi:acyl carrier protein
MMGAEFEFNIEISNDDHERMHTVNDMVEAIATNWHTD